MCNKTIAEEIIYATGSPGLEYEINTDNRTCSITSIGTCTDSIVYIPEYKDGYEVTKIADRAFYNCKTITEITVPKTITYIGFQIFYKASNLYKVNYNSTYQNSNNPFLDLSHITTISFGGNYIPSNILKGNLSVKNVIISDNVNSIGYAAFSGCTNLVTLNISIGIEKIGNEAFAYCKNLSNVIIPNTVTYIGNYAFSNCSNIENITIPSSITSIGYGTFSSCTELKSIIIPDSVISIDDWAFSLCESIESITIPDSVVSIGDYVFLGCDNLSEIKYDGVVEQWRMLNFWIWNYNIPATQVICSDGTAPIN